MLQMQRWFYYYCYQYVENLLKTAIAGGKRRHAALIDSNFNAAHGAGNHSLLQNQYFS